MRRGSIKDLTLEAIIPLLKYEDRELQYSAILGYTEALFRFAYKLGRSRGVQARTNAKRSARRSSKPSSRP